MSSTRASLKFNIVQPITLKVLAKEIIHTITAEIENGTYEGASKKNPSQQVVGQIKSSDPQYFLLPGTVVVTGTTDYEYDQTTGKITINKSTGNITIKAVCRETIVLATPLLTIDGKVLTIIDLDGRADAFEIYAATSDTPIKTVNKSSSASGTTCDLTNVTHAVTKIKVKAITMDGSKESNYSNEVDYNGYIPPTIPGDNHNSLQLSQADSCVSVGDTLYIE